MAISAHIVFQVSVNIMRPKKDGEVFFIVKVHYYNPREVKML